MPSTQPSHANDLFSMVKNICNILDPFPHCGRFFFYILIQKQIQDRLVGQVPAAREFCSARYERTEHLMQHLCKNSTVKKLAGKTKISLV